LGVTESRSHSRPESVAYLTQLEFMDGKRLLPLSFSSYKLLDGKQIPQRDLRWASID
jgi:hypothetical protein